MTAAGGMSFDAPVVVFLANDRILHWAVPFLESLRATNPTVALLMIPFDSAVERLAALREVYRFSILAPDFTEIARFADIAFPQPDPVLPRLRKLVLFDIEAPAVVYIDADTIVTRDLAPLLSVLAAATGRRLIYASESRGWAYRKGAALPPRLAAGRQFSSGFLGLCGPPIGSGVLLRAVREHLVDYLHIRAANVIDQPVVNLAIDVLGIEVARIDEATGIFSARNWYLDANIRERDGELRDERGLAVPFLHWAGAHRAASDAPFWDRFEAARRAGEPRVSTLQADPDRRGPIGLF